MWVPFGRVCCWLPLVDGLLVIVCLSLSQPRLSGFE
jgi:hypothetical protein